MTRSQSTAVALLAVALGLGVAGDLLFHGQALGLNAVVFAAAFVLALAGLVRVAQTPLHQGRRLMAAPLLIFAGLLAWHNSPLLVATNMLAICGAIALGALRRTERGVKQAEVSDYAIGAAGAGAASFAGALELIERDVPWDRLATSLRGRRAGAIGRGALLALPLVAIFGALFLAADVVFRSLLVSAIPDWRHAWTHVLLAVGFGWLSAGLLRDLLAARESERLLAPATAALRAPRLRVGTTELAAALALVDLLFLSFVLVQLRYLFGGQALVEARVHLTYAQYARHGFFELVAVALLVLPVLLAVDYVSRDAERRSRLVHALAGVLIVLVLVVMASALERMRLYEREYGLTELRIYATGVILWLGAVFVLLAATILRGRRRAFASGAVLAGFVATLALNAVNPDALIARTNLDRPHVDATYLSHLSADAVPTLVTRLPSLPPRLRRPIAAELLRRHEPRTSWLSWNESRTHARTLLETHHAELVRLAAR